MSLGVSESKRQSEKAYDKIVKMVDMEINWFWKNKFEINYRKKNQAKNLKEVIAAIEKSPNAQFEELSELNKKDFNLLKQLVNVRSALIREKK